MKTSQKLLLFILIVSLIGASCKKDPDNFFLQGSVDLSTHSLATYSKSSNSKYIVVFESGLGDDHTVWQANNIAEDISKKMDVITYDRAGYGKSTIDNSPRNIERLSIELDAIVNKFANGRKVILIGHSLGGLIIRDYAIKNPGKIAALLFVDPSHEYYNQPTQVIEDMIYNEFKNTYGINYGATKETRELIEDLAYTSSLPDLPNVPVTVLTSMKLDQPNINADQSNNKTRQDWFNAHELLKNAVADFTHIATTKSGHYIMKEESKLLVDNLNLLISKLP